MVSRDGWCAVVATDGNVGRYCRGWICCVWVWRRCCRDARGSRRCRCRETVAVQRVLVVVAVLARVGAPVLDVRGTQTIKLATVFGVVDVILEEKFFHFEKRSAGKKWITTSLMLRPCERNVRIGLVLLSYSSIGGQRCTQIEINVIDVPSDGVTEVPCQEECG